MIYMISLERNTKAGDHCIYMTYFKKCVKLVFHGVDTYSEKFSCKQQKGEGGWAINTILTWSILLDISVVLAIVVVSLLTMQLMTINVRALKMTISKSITKLQSLPEINDIVILENA